MEGNLLNVEGSIIDSIVIQGQVKDSTIVINKRMDSDTVSFMKLEVNKTNLRETLSELATEINVNLKEDDKEIEFVPPMNFKDWQKKENRMLLYGISGCGKSRTIFEIVRSRLTRFQNIYIVNPQNPSGKTVERATISELTTRFSKDDAIVWDNFPLDFPQGQSKEHGEEALKKISSRKGYNLIVTLNPSYMDLYRNSTIIEIPFHEIRYEEKSIKTIIELYGNNISKFNDIYKKIIRKQIDEISLVLYNREGIPSTVDFYYKELAERKSAQYLNPVSLANEFLLPTEYYDQSFNKFIINDRSAAEFLYTLKLCYELKLTRTPNYIKNLQSVIFESNSPSEPLRFLSTWLYFSSGLYSMPDLARNAIQFSDDAKVKIVNQLISDKFLEIHTPTRIAAYQLGVFIGMNIQFLEPDAAGSFLPEDISKLMKYKKGFKEGLGSGLGLSFSSFKREMQEIILDVVRKEGNEKSGFSYGLIRAIGTNFFTLENEISEEIWEISSKNLGCADGLGYTLGISLPSLNSAMQEDVWRTAVKNRALLPSFAYTLGAGVQSLSHPIQEKIWQLTEKNEDFCSNFAYSLGVNFPFLNSDLQGKIWAMTSDYKQFARSLSLGLLTSFALFDSEMQSKIMEISNLDDYEFGYSLAEGLITNISFLRSYLHDGIDGITSVAGNEFIRGLGAGLGVNFSLLSKDIYEKILKIAEEMWLESDWFAVGLGFGLGLNFSKFDQDFQQKIWKLAEENIAFAGELARGLGSNFSLLSDETRQKIWELVESNSSFAGGLGETLFENFHFVDPMTQQRIWDIAERNRDFGATFGYHMGYTFSLLSEENQQKILDMAEFAVTADDYIGADLSTLQKETQERVERISTIIYDTFRGLGYNFQSINSNIQEKILTLAKKDKDLIKELGLGIGDIFPFLSPYIQELIILEASKNESLVEGLDRNLGKKFRSINKDMQHILLDSEYFVYKLSGINSRDFYSDIGIDFDSLEVSVQDKILEIAQRNNKVASEVARGIGEIFFSITNEDSKVKIWDMIETNEEFALGIAYNLAKNYSIQGEDTEKKIWNIVESNVRFAEEYLRSLSTNFITLKVKSQKKLLEYAGKNTNVLQGLIQNLSFEDFSSLTEDVQLNILALLNFLSKLIDQVENTTYSMLTEDVQLNILALLNFLSKLIDQVEGATFSPFSEAVYQKVSTASNDASKLIGMIGKDFISIKKDEMQRRVLSLSLLSQWYAHKLAHSLSYNFISFRHEMQLMILNVITEVDSDPDTGELFINELVNGVFQKLLLEGTDVWTKFMLLSEKNNVFGKRLLEMAGENFSSLDAEIHKIILDEAMKNDEFTYSFGSGLATNFSMLRKDAQDYVLEMIQKNRIYADGFYKGLFGDTFSSLGSAVQIKILNIADERGYFAQAPSTGIIESVRSISRLADDFPSLSSDVQEKILNLTIKYKNFASDFLHFRIELSKLSSELQEKILNIAKKNRRFARELISEKPSNVDFDFKTSFHLSDLNLNIQEQILDIATNDPLFAKLLSSRISNEDVKTEIGKKLIALTNKSYVDDFISLAERGSNLDSEGKFNEAIRCYNKALKLDPFSSDVWSAKGMSLHELQRYDEAIDCFNEALKLDPYISDIWSAKGMSLHELQRYDEAIDSYDKVIAIDPDNMVAFMAKGTIFFDAEKYDDAIASFSKALDLSPDDPTTSSLLSRKGDAFFALEKYDEAIACYKESIETDPQKKDDTLNNIAFSYLRLEKYNEGITYFDRAIATNPSNPESLHGKGLCFLLLENYDEAIDYFSRAISLERDYAEAWYYRACAKNRKGLVSDSLVDLKRAIAVNKEVKQLALEEGFFPNLKDADISN